MEQFYNNFIFINQYLKEERYRYCSFYEGEYKDFYVSIKLGEFNKIIMYSNINSRVRLTCKVCASECLEDNINKLINKYE